ncbi:MAG: hypothetical protein KGZ25_05090 [Planctomycetes bacterium]|nr:hypothetical protein [Planctomycetota bacterium]
MTRRENLLTAMRGGMPEWIPITGHVDPYNQPSRENMDPELAEALGTLRWGDDSTVLFSKYLDLDVMDWFSGAPVRSMRQNVSVETHREDVDTIRIWHTPRGDLREVSRQCREDGTTYRVEHLDKGPDDLPALASISADEQFEINPDRAEVYRHRKELIGDDGFIAFTVPSTPLGQMIRLWAGVQTTAYLWADAPEALRETFQVMENNLIQRIEAACQFDAEAIITVDDTSTTTVSPAMFQKLCMDYTDRAADLVHAHDKLYVHHSCGLIKNLLPLYRQTEMDCVHSFTVPPIGDVTVREGRELLGLDIAIFAGLVQLAQPIEDWDEVGASIRQMFEGASPGAGFILGLTAYPDKTMDQTRRILEICRGFQSL